MKPLFEIGKLVATPGAVEALNRNNQNPIEFINLHIHGDYGDLSKEDEFENDFAINHGLRILSAYTLRDGTKIRVITEADRSATIILLPEEY
jgi:hypothetical protein